MLVVYRLFIIFKFVYFSEDVRVCNDRDGRPRGRWREEDVEEGAEQARQGRQEERSEGSRGQLPINFSSIESSIIQY